GTSTFNQLLKAEVEGGLLNIAISELALGGSPVPITSDLLSAFIPEFGNLPSGTQLRIVVAPTISPIFSGNLGPNGELEDLRISQLDISIQSANGAITYLDIGADARVGINLVYN